MNQFRYRIYYRWDGTSHSDPIVREKNASQIGQALREFPDDLARLMKNPDAQIEVSWIGEGEKELYLCVRTAVSRSQVDSALAEVLREQRLYAEEIQGPPDA